MPDRLRLEGLTLGVASDSRSVEYCSGLLGLEVGYVSKPAFAMIKVGGDLELLPVEEAHKEGAEDMSPARRRAIHVEFSTDGLDTLDAEPTARGMAFHEPPGDARWERVMSAFDPDGYAAEIAQGGRGQDGAN